ncbi:MAG: M28 family peptidase [Candidatus Marinimicrobia bacterium]|nr:M28 family peptidase [Candidatus Neomarinimicrobiota bacterium]MCF7850329.1 M28 family peptidase [Candidatus Neomarinimicrobiota bacterium]MCF7904523.1 M28 family peptidase [Candidatus Neomarinimicrobiota bacterium]
MLRIVFTRILLTLSFISLVAPAFAQPAFDSYRAYDDLVAQCDLGPREPSSMGALKAIAYYQNILEPLADEFHLQGFTLPDPYSEGQLNLVNIVARFQSEKTDRVILCAHWDTRPRAEYDPHEPDKPIIGANDGASGVAVLLELARVLSVEPTKPGIDIVLFDGEDYGKPGDLQNYLLGSRYYAENPIDPLPQQVILVDMVGDAELSIKIDPVSYRSAPRLVEEIWMIARNLGFDQFKYSFGDAMYDDHVPFIEKGIPAIDIIDFEYPGPGNHYWHTHEDTPDKCSPESLEAVGKTLVTWLYSQ